MTNFPLSRYRGHVRSGGTLQDDLTRCLEQSLSLYITEWNVLAPGGVWTSHWHACTLNPCFCLLLLAFVLWQTLGDSPAPGLTIMFTFPLPVLMLLPNTLFFITYPVLSLAVPAVIFFLILFTE